MDNLSLLALTALLSLGAPNPADKHVGFGHRAHAEPLSKASRDWPCARCHAGAERGDTEPPGQRGHGVCDNRACHAKEFYDPAELAKTEVCLVCHVSTRYTETNETRAFPYVPNDPELRAAGTFRQLYDYYAEFSHRGHMTGKASRPKPPKCLDCHRVTADGERLRPGHDACNTCHSADEPTGDAAPMSDCATCHRLRRDQSNRLVRTGPRFRPTLGRVTGRFFHTNHLERRTPRRRKWTGPQVGCEACHDQVAEAKTVGSIVPTAGAQTMDRCRACHRVGLTAPSGEPMISTDGECSYCHKPQFVESLFTPPSHRP